MSDEVNDNQGQSTPVPPPYAPPPVPAYAPESREERWVKYGLNVGLVSLLVIILAALVIWAAQTSIPFRGKSYSFRGRADMTSSGSYSLKP